MEVRMGLLELLIIVILLFWLFGYFGRGRFYGSRGGTAVSDGGLIAGGSWIHTLLVIVVILIVLRLLGVHF
jgi:TM2 domain-containing membrane protein YozV